MSDGPLLDWGANNFLVCSINNKRFLCCPLFLIILLYNPYTHANFDKTGILKILYIKNIDSYTKESNYISLQ